MGGGIKNVSRISLPVTGNTCDFYAVLALLCFPSIYTNDPISLQSVKINVNFHMETTGLKGASRTRGSQMKGVILNPPVVPSPSSLAT